MAPTASRELAAALDQLPAEERAAVFLRDVRQLPLNVVADCLNCSVATARLRVARGRLHLLQELKRAA